MIFNILKLNKIVLWPHVIYLEKGLCMLEKNVFPAAIGWNILLMSVCLCL
jgi:hypothetical protein